MESVKKIQILEIFFIWIILQSYIKKNYKVLNKPKCEVFFENNLESCEIICNVQQNYIFFKFLIENIDSLNSCLEYPPNLQ